MVRWVAGLAGLAAVEGVVADAAAVGLAAGATDGLDADTTAAGRPFSMGSFDGAEAVPD